MKKPVENKIDELLEQALKNFRAETSASDWEEISRKLDEEKGAFFSWKKILFPLALLLVFVSGGSVFYFQNKGSGNSKTNESNISESHIGIGEKMLSTEENSNKKSEDKNFQKQINSKIKADILETKNSDYLTSNTRIKITPKNGNSTKNETEFSNKTNIHKNEKNLPITDYKEKENQDNSDIEKSFQNRENAGEKIFSEEDVLRDSEIIIADSLLEIAEEKVVEKTNQPVKIPKNPLDKKFAVGISLAPEFNGFSGGVAAGKFEQVHKNYIKKSGGQVKPAGGFSASIFLQYAIWKKVYLQSGLRYTRFVEKTDYNYFNNQVPVIDSASKKILGYIEMADTATTFYKGRNTYSYASIPLTFGYEVSISRKVSLALRAGGSAMILVNADGKNMRSDDLTLEEFNTNDLRKLNWTLNFSPSIYYHLNQEISLGLEPTWQYFLQPIKQDAAVTKTFSSMSIGLSLRFSPF